MARLQQELRAARASGHDESLNSERKLQKLKEEVQRAKEAAAAQLDGVKAEAEAEAKQLRAEAAQHQRDLRKALADNELAERLRAKEKAEMRESLAEAREEGRRSEHAVVQLEGRVDSLASRLDKAKAAADKALREAQLHHEAQAAELAREVEEVRKLAALVSGGSRVPPGLHRESPAGAIRAGGVGGGDARTRDLSRRARGLCCPPVVCACLCCSGLSSPDILGCRCADPRQGRGSAAKRGNGGGSVRDHCLSGKRELEVFAAAPQGGGAAASKRDTGSEKAGSHRLGGEMLPEQRPKQRPGPLAI